MESFLTSVTHDAFWFERTGFVQTSQGNVHAGLQVEDLLSSPGFSLISTHIISLDKLKRIRIPLAVCKDGGLVHVLTIRHGN